MTLLLECWLLASVWDGGTAAVNIGGWLPPWGIVMVVDQFSSLMLVVSSAVSLAVLIYATGQGMADGDQDAPVSIFHPTYLILVAGRVQRLPLRGPVQPLRGLRDPADGELRADDTRRDGPADPGRRDLRGGLGGVLRALPDCDRHDLRGHRNHQHGRPRPQARRTGPGHPEPAARHAARGLRDQGRRVPAVLLAAGLLPDGAGPGHGRVRRPADQGGRVRHGPDRNAAVPGRHASIRR